MIHYRGNSLFVKEYAKRYNLVVLRNAEEVQFMVSLETCV